MRTNPETPFQPIDGPVDFLPVELVVAVGRGEQQLEHMTWIERSQPTISGKTNELGQPKSHDGDGGPPILRMALPRLRTEYSATTETKPIPQSTPCAMTVFTSILSDIARRQWGLGDICDSRPFYLPALPKLGSPLRWYRRASD